MRQQMAMRLLIGGAASLLPAFASAEPVLDRVMSGATVTSAKGCDKLEVTFNLRIAYASHFPTGSGQELRIRLRPIDPSLLPTETLARRESVRAPVATGARLRAIEFEASDAAGPVLVIQFDAPMRFKVAQGPKFQSIVVAIPTSASGAAACEPVLPPGASQTDWLPTIQAEAPIGAGSARAAGRGGGKASPTQAQAAGAALDEGRAALRKGDHARAIEKFRTVLRQPENEYSAEAQELLALAYQRSGNAAGARAEYDDYLVRYPSGEAAERVRQRLTALATANDRDKPALRAAKSRDASGRNDGVSTWTVSGSASQFYIRDDSYRTLRDPTLPRAVNEELDAHKVHQNELLSSLDLVATWNGNGVKSKFRFSGTEEHKFDDDDERDIVGVSALFLDTAFKDWGAEARIGRQTRNSGGVLGRFDGVLAGYRLTDQLRLNGVVGSPVARRRDEPYKDEKLFYGASLDFGPYFGGFDASVFFIEQRADDVLDRRAVGAELRYIDPVKSAFATVDYDVHYQTLNAAIVSGSWTLTDKSTFNASLDYRRSPYISTWTALNGQPFPTLFQMLKQRTLAEVEVLALDRTATYKAATVGFSRPINDWLQVSLDATVTNLEGTVESGGVPAVLPTGNEYFAGGQLIASNVLAEGDLFIVGVRYADLSTTDLYALDLSARYPLYDGLKINPRLRLSYQTGDDTDMTEYSVLPSLLFNYFLTRDWSFELEVGARYTVRNQAGVEETDTDLFLTVGYRYDFYADGTYGQPMRSNTAPK